MLRRTAAVLLVLALLLPAQPAYPAFVWADNVREMSSTTGTGNLTLAGAVTGYVTFNSAMANGDTCYYSIRNRDVPSEWEVGAGTYNDTDVLARTFVVASSNAGSAVNFSAGLKDVWMAPVSYALHRIPVTMSSRNYSSADQAISASTETMVTGGAIPVSGSILTGGLYTYVGSTITWRLTIDKTAAGTSTSSIAVQWGTTATPSDADILTFALPAGSANIDTAIIEITMQVRGPTGASCIAIGTLYASHNLTTTGFFTQSDVVVTTVSSAYNSTTAGAGFSLVLTTGASQAWTVRQVVTEARGF